MTPIAWLVNKVHITATDEDIIEMFTERCKKQELNEFDTKQVIEKALEIHHANRDEYFSVMGGWFQ